MTLHDSLDKENFKYFPYKLKTIGSGCFYIIKDLSVKQSNIFLSCAYSVFKIYFFKKNCVAKASDI